MINVNIQSMRSQDKFAAFLEYSQLLYNYLSIIPVDEFASISSSIWLHETKITKSSFKCLENYLCLAGEDAYNKNKGEMCIYYTKMPKIQQLDDDRLSASITLKSRYEFNSPVTIVEQFANTHYNTANNNCLAISLKNTTQILIMPTSQAMNDRGNQNSQNPIIFKGHTDLINRIKWGRFSNRNYKLFSASVDKTVIQWDLEKMTEERQMKYHRESVNDVIPLHNDEHLTWDEGPQMESPEMIGTASTDGYVFLWDCRVNNPVNRINCKQKQLYSLQNISRNSFLTGGIDGSIKFWDLRHNKEYSYDNSRDKLEGHKGKVAKMQRLRPEIYSMKEYQNPHVGKIKFVSCGDDGKIIIWQEKNQFTHEGHYSPISDFDYLPSAGYFVSAAKGSTNIMIWQEGVTMGPLEK